MAKKQNKKSSSAVPSGLGHLSAAEVRQLLKPRAGFEPFVAQLAAVYRANPSTMKMAGVDPDALLAQLKEYEALAPVVSAAKQSYTKAQETRLSIASNVWRVVLLMYKRARVIGETDEDVMHAITDFEKFMKVGRRKPKTTPGAA